MSNQQQSDNRDLPIRTAKVPRMFRVDPNFAYEAQRTLKTLSFLGAFIDDLPDPNFNSEKFGLIFFTKLMKFCQVKLDELTRIVKEAEKND